MFLSLGYYTRERKASTRFRRLLYLSNRRRRELPNAGKNCPAPCPYGRNELGNGRFAMAGGLICGIEESAMRKKLTESSGSISIAQVDCIVSGLRHYLPCCVHGSGSDTESRDPGNGGTVARRSLTWHIQLVADRTGRMMRAARQIN